MFIKIIKIQYITAKSRRWKIDAQNMQSIKISILKKQAVLNTPLQNNLLSEVFVQDEDLFLFNKFLKLTSREGRKEIDFFN